jgi:hypothetical protein
VSLTVFDVQGRRVAAPLNKALQSAGTHSVPLRVAGWPQGFYFLRLEAGGVAATRKVVVIP